MVSYEINKAGQKPCFIYLVRAKGLELITNAADYLFYAIIFLAACSSLRSKLRVKNRGFHSDQYKRGTQGTPFVLVRAKGLEPSRRGHQILSLARLPIPPRPHMMILLKYTTKPTLCQAELQK